MFGSLMKNSQTEFILAIFDTIVDFRHGLPFIVSFVKNEDCNVIISIRDFNSISLVQGIIRDIDNELREKLSLLKLSKLDKLGNLSLKLQEFIVYSLFSASMKKIPLYFLNKIFSSIVINQLKNISIKKNSIPNIIFTSENIIKKMPKLFENISDKNKVFVIYETYNVFPLGQSLLPILEKGDSFYVIEHPQSCISNHNSRIIKMGIPRYWCCYILETVNPYKISGSGKISNVLYVGQKVLSHDAEWTNSVVQSDDIFFSLAKILPQVQFFVKPHPRNGRGRYLADVQNRGLSNVKVLNAQDRLLPKSVKVDLIIGGMGTSALAEAVVLDYPIVFFKGIDIYNEFINLGSPTYSIGYPRYDSVESLLILLEKDLKNIASSTRREFPSYMGDPCLTVDQSDKYIYDYIQQAIHA